MKDDTVWPNMIEVDHIIGGCEVKSREQLEGLLEDVINLRSGGVRCRNGPKLVDTFVGGNNILEACDDVIGGEARIPAGLKECGRDLDVPLAKVVVLGVRECRDIKAAHIHLMGVTFSIHVTG